MNEKRKPHYRLSEIKASFDDTKPINWTRTAMVFAYQNGWSDHEVLGLISGIQSDHFDKSMCSYKDNKIWQDVYFVPCPIQGPLLGVLLYVKFTVDPNGFLLISLKESAA